MTVGAHSIQARQQFSPPEPFVEQRHRIVGDLLEELTGQAHFTASVRAQLRIQDHVRAHIHQRHQTHHGKRRLAVARGVSRPEVFSELGRIRSTQKCSIHREYLQVMPGITVIALRAPLVASLAEQPLNGVGTEPFTSFGYTTTGQ
ncbi:hypothetical protein D3C87_1325590 [compost metagenome]